MPPNYRLILESVVDPVLVVDEANRILYLNSAAHRLLGRGPADLADRPLDIILPGRLSGSRAGSFVDHVGRPFRLPVLHGNGAEIEVEISVQTITDEHGRDLLVACLRDVRKRLDLERQEERLRDQLEFANAIAHNLSEGVCAFDRHGRIAFVNLPARQMLRCTEIDLIGQDVHDVIHRRRVHSTGDGPDSCQLHQAVREHLRVRVPDDRFTRKDNTTFPVAYSVSTLETGGYAVGGVLAFQDMTERKRVEDEIRHHALHDPLTGLPNRLLLQDRLNQAILTARREELPLTLLFIDLDRFKEVNDTLGHERGDHVLRDTGQRIRGVVRASDTVARLGGDEFAVILPGAREDSAVHIADKITEALSEPFAVGGERFEVGGSIGIAVYPDHADTTVELIRRADLAMYAAKRGRQSYTVFGAAPSPHRRTRSAAARRSHRDRR